MDGFVEKIKAGLLRNEVVTIFANCSVVYDGRAKSFLDKGDRIIIIKRDGSLLVHQPEGNMPVNYMKPKSSHTLKKENSIHLLKSSNLVEKEFLDVFLHEIYHVHSQALSDFEKLQLSGSEKDMSDMIYNNPGVIEKGFKPLSREEHTKYGFIDVFGYDKNNVLTVVECKRYSADLSAVTQLRRYVEKIKSSKGLEKVRGILAAPRISSNALAMLHDFGFEFRKVNPPNYLERFSKKQVSLSKYQQNHKKTYK